MKAPASSHPLPQRGEGANSMRSSFRPLGEKGPGGRRVLSLSLAARQGRNSKFKNPNSREYLPKMTASHKLALQRGRAATQERLHYGVHRDHGEETMSTHLCGLCELRGGSFLRGTTRSKELVPQCAVVVFTASRSAYVAPPNLGLAAKSALEL